MRLLRNVVCGLLVAMSAPVAADAGLVMTLTENTGSSVLLTYSGAINTSGLISIAPMGGTSEMNPSTGSIRNGTTVFLWVIPSPSAGSSFGSGGNANPSFASGSNILTGFFNTSLLGLPVGYTSLSPLSGTMSFNGTFASLGITAGVRSFSWGGGGTGQTVTLNVVPAPVPEIDPATGGSAISLIAGVLAMIEQRRRRATPAA